MEKLFGGAEEVKKARLQTHKRLYELLQMEENKSISDFFTRVTRLVNQTNTCDEIMSTKSIISNILRSLSPRFNHTVVTIEESKDLSSLKKMNFKGLLNLMNKEWWKGLQAKKK